MTISTSRRDPAVDRAASLPARVREVVNRVSKDHGVSPLDVLGRSMAPSVRLARKACWREVRALRRPDGKQFSFEQLGRWFGRRHCVIMVALRPTDLELWQAFGRGAGTASRS